MCVCVSVCVYVDLVYAVYLHWGAEKLLARLLVTDAAGYGLSALTC